MFHDCLNVDNTLCYNLCVLYMSDSGEPGVFGFRHDSFWSASLVQMTLNISLSLGYIYI